MAAILFLQPPEKVQRQVVYRRSQPQRARFFTLQSASTLLPRNRRDLILRLIIAKGAQPITRLPLNQRGDVALFGTIASADVSGVHLLFRQPRMAQSILAR